MKNEEGTVGLARFKVCYFRAWTQCQNLYLGHRERKAGMLTSGLEPFLLSY
jgi:hypothetical protein